jgi:conjugal transfer pilus assembly protein TraD
METMNVREFRAYCKQPEHVFLGFGFEWHPVHSQRLYELSKIHFRDFIVSPWLLRLLGYPVDPQPDAEVGLPYIHGVEPREHALRRPLVNFEGGTIIVGTTQSGKRRTMSVLASQAVYRGDVVIIIDPELQTT